jgi:membrane associated rhomboid family serine protease
VELGAPESFVADVVAAAGKGPLGEQATLERTACGDEYGRGLLGIEVRIERFGPELGEQREARVLARGDDPDSSEAARVAEPERTAIGLPEHPDMAGRRGAGADLTGHAEVDDQLGGVVEVEEKELATATHRGDRAPERSGGAGEAGSGVGDDREEAGTANGRLELAAQRLDLRKLRHGRDRVGRLSRCPAAEGLAQRAQVGTVQDMNRTPFTHLMLWLCAATFLLQIRPGSTLTDLGALYGPAVLDGELWRLVSAGFLHGSFLHLGFNLLALFVLGRLVEPLVTQRGPWAYPVLYLGSLLGGSMGAMALQFEAPAVGASGAIFGLLGAALTLPRRLGYGWNAFGVAPWLGLNLVITFTIPQISIGGHLGGLLVGGVLGWVLAPRGPLRGPWGPPRPEDRYTGPELSLRP